jgi:hypothetical protein
MTENFLLSNRFLSKHNRNRDRLFIQPKSGTAIAFEKNKIRTAIALLSGCTKLITQKSGSKAYIASKSCVNNFVSLLIIS